MPLPGAQDMKAAENQDFISQGSTNNATCFIGPHRQYDPFTKSFLNLVPGQGHFGPDAIPGDARWRRGESVSLKTARDTCDPCTQTRPRPLSRHYETPNPILYPTQDGRHGARAVRRHLKPTPATTLAHPLPCALHRHAQMVYSHA